MCTCAIGASAATDHATRSKVPAVEGVGICNVPARLQKFIILNTKVIIFNAESIIFECKSYHFQHACKVLPPHSRESYEGTSQQALATSTAAPPVQNCRIAELQNCRIAELQNSSFLKQTTSFRTKTSSFLIFNDNTKSTSNGHGLSDSRDVMLMSCVKMGDETQSKISQKPSETSTKSHHLSWAAAIAASLCSVRVFPRGAGFTDRSIITDLRTYHTRSIDEFLH